MVTIKKQARLAGLLYLLLGVTAPVALLYVPSKLMVADNPAATIENIRNSPSLLRLGIAFEMIHQIIAIFVVLELYRLFRPVSVRLARQLIVLGCLISIPIMFVNILNEVATLLLLSGADYLSSFTTPQLDGLAYMFTRLHARGLDVASVFWGLWLFPFGLLVIKSGFIPRFLGYLLFVAGGAYVVNSFITFCAPQYLDAFGKVAIYLYFGEPPIMLWLLIWGARGPRANEPMPAW